MSAGWGDHRCSGDRISAGSRQPRMLCLLMRFHSLAFDHGLIEMSQNLDSCFLDLVGIVHVVNMWFRQLEFDYSVPPTPLLINLGFLTLRIKFDIDCRRNNMILLRSYMTTIPNIQSSQLQNGLYQPCPSSNPLWPVRYRQLVDSERVLTYRPRCSGC